MSIEKLRNKPSINTLNPNDMLYLAKELEAQGDGRIKISDLSQLYPNYQYLSNTLEVYATKEYANTLRQRKTIILSNNITNPDTRIDFAEGFIILNDGTRWASSAITKRLDATWVVGNNQGGLDTGAKANSTWYHCYGIYNPTTQVGDVIFSVNASLPLLPSGFTKYKLLESIYVLSNGNIMTFQDDGMFMNYSLVTEATTLTGTTLRTLNIRAPLGRAVKSLVFIEFAVGSASGYSGVNVYTGDGVHCGRISSYGALGGGGNLGSSGFVFVNTNNSSEIKVQPFNSFASFNVYSAGWVKNSF